MVDRSQFILTTSVEYFSVISTSSDDIAIREFCENDDITILAATTMGQKIHFQHKIPTEENCLLFYKIPQFGNMSNQTTTTTTTGITKTAIVASREMPLGILTLEGGLVKSIYNSVSRVFSPHLTKKYEYSPEIEKIIENLHATLGSSLGLPQSEIHNVQDEINFWNEKTISSPTKSDKMKARDFAATIANLNEQIRSIDSNSIKSIEEFLNSTHTVLDEIWRLPHNYPQNRMTDLMNIIDLIVIDACADNLSNEDIWNIHSFHTMQTINEIKEIVDIWIQVCDSLTRLFWPNNGQHPWVGDAHIPKQSIKFQERLAEIKSIKDMYKQIASIFGESDELSISEIFSLFEEINIFDITPFGEKLWKKSVHQFEFILQPVDEKLAQLLKNKLHHQMNNPRQVVHLFTKYLSILKRPTIMNLLSVEREHFLQSILQLIDDLKNCLNQPSSAQGMGNMSQICWECRWLRVVEHQINEISKVKHLIKDKDGYDDVEKSLTALQVEIEKLLKTNFELWREDSMDAIKNGDLVLKDDKPVVEFKKDGRQLMQVTFKPKLVTFCYDCREMETLGFRIPLELRDTAVHANKFMAYARRLQQVANFHNTIGDRMIPCQRPIMLKNAIELSKLVQSESVKWNDEESVNRYVSKMQVAVNKLSNDNTFLVGQHELFKKIITRLINTDLLRQGQIWKDEMRHLRDLIGSLESKGYSNLHSFKLHWDHQLYKVLEYQYIAGLNDLSHKLPDIGIDIVFRQQQLQFRPPMEETRLKYYSQLRRFIERPLGFHGLSEKSNALFRIMVDRNGHQFTDLYKRAENLFDQLNELRESWLPWVALGCVNLEELCDVHLNTWKDWDKNFKACKHFSQAIAKIQNSEERIDCFVINLIPLRSDIEFISRKYWEILANSLRTSILKEVSTLQDFLNTSLQILQNVPLDETGIAEAGAKYEAVKREFPKMAEMLKSVHEKDTCLAGWCKERVTALANIRTQWDQLQPLIDNHSAVLQRQIDIMRGHVESQMANLKEEAERFLIRWESAIEDLETNESTTLTVFRERQQNWSSIKEKRDTMEIDCVKYTIEFPSELREMFGKIENSIETQGEQWQLFEEFQKEADEIMAEEWTVYRRRPYILTNFLSNWNNNKKLSNNAASMRIQKMLDSYQAALPVLQTLQSDGLTEQHWAKIFFMLKEKPKIYHDICVKDILSNVGNLQQNATEIQNLVRQAASEQVVRQAITELDQWGVTAVLKTTIHNDSRGDVVTLITDFQDVLNKIGDNQCLLQSAKNSSSFDVFLDQAELWETRLSQLDHTLSGLNQIQRKWIYLEPIFGTGTLKTEEASFKRIDKDFRFVMREISNDPRVLSVTKIANISTIISALENQLTRCHKTLTSFISNKRNAFPRFYFLSDDDLLEILGQSSKIDVVQKHIKKLFPGIHKLKVNVRDNMAFISAICSAEGDEVTLKNVIQITGLVEDWLNQLVVEIKFTLKDLIRSCAQNDFLDEQQIKMFPIQVLCAAKSISFTRLTEKAISSMNLQTHLNTIRDEINRYSSSQFQNSDHLFQIKVRALLLDLVHHVSIVESLLKKNVTTDQDWLWLQQLKFYINSRSDVTIKMVFAEFEYSYEYLGNTNKLVHTALTHRCYLTLTQAMHLGLGGNPFGPAGTGKTECVKALGAMMGRLVLVFNCNENVDTASMGLILSGLARCGAWGCFDEFNRLDEATLSAISMLIQPLQIALKEKQESITLFEESIPLNSHCGIFVTLNPAGEEYGGRQSLPGNLQALFRPIVMQHPEPIDIARVMLFVEGFKSSNEISARMVELFSMAGKMLSPQRHYEWGLRELKTILLACGKSLRDANNESRTTDDEMNITVQALRSNTMSKLSSADCKLFDMLIADIFPNANENLPGNESLRNAVREAFTTLGLLANDVQVEKCLQLYEQLVKRMGVVVLGPPGSGKTTIIMVLKQALTATLKTIRTYTIAPKSMNRLQLLGKLDPDTRQWNDGVLTTTAVAVNSEPNDITSWIICDGDIDPEWIEALNSVLDDNKLLTLPSGWRIQFSNNVNFIFETHDLKNASPATISRMGIINLSAEDLSGSVLIDSWLNRISNSDIMRLFMDQYFDNALEWIENCHEKSLPMVRTNVIKNALYFVEGANSKEEYSIGLVRGFGNMISGNELNRFCNYVFDLIDVLIPGRSHAEYCYYNSFRDNIEIYETNSIQSADHSTDSLIKTAQIKIYADILKEFIKRNNMPFLMIGPPGSGKSLLLQNVVAEFSGYQFIVINCSAQLSANFILYVLKQNCLVISGIRGREYKPKFTKVIVYFKNINLCHQDKWGSSEVIELLLQLIHRNGFYARETLEWISVSGVQICGSLTDGSECNLSPRFLSIVKSLTMTYPSENDMQLIVKSHLEPVYKHFNPSNGKLKIDDIVGAMIKIYTTISEKFTQNQRNHYRFSPKLITECIIGLMHYPKENFQQAFLSELNANYRNRLAVDKHKLMFDETLHTIFQNLFKMSDTNVYFIPAGAKTSDLMIISPEELTETIRKNVTICCIEDIILETPITSELLLLVTSISRALSREQCNLLLCGQIGIGRTDALHIACTMLNVKIFNLVPVANYRLEEFYNDLKIAMQSAALDDHTVVLFIDHAWLTYLPELMKPIEALLEGSEVPEIFGDDLETIASPLRLSAQQDGFQESLSTYFWKRVKSNLHLVISLESSSSDTEELFNQFPSLYANTEMIFLNSFSNHSIATLPKQLIQTISNSSEQDEIPILNFYQLLVGKWKTSPLRYKQLIKTYYFIYKTNESKLNKQRNKLQLGVDKLSAANAVVEQLKNEANEQEIALAEKRKLANQALEMISSTMRNATDQRTDLLSLKQKTQESSETIMQRKKAIELELKEVEPILKEASVAVGQIKGEALSEIRSLRAPPDIIRDILEGVLRLMGTRDTSWNSMKSFLAKRGVKEDIRSLDPGRITAENCQAVEKLLKNKSESFEQKNARRASVAAAPLAAWVVANVKYAKVVQSIKPLEREQNSLEKDLEKSEYEMKSLISGLDDVDARVNELSKQLNVYTQEAAMLEIKLEQARNTLKSAEVLVEKLTTEYTIWSQQLQAFNKNLKELDVKSFLISLNLSHLSYCTFEMRQTLLKPILEEFNIDGYSLTTNIISDQDKIIWESMGLTGDVQSMENASILSQILKLPYGTCPTPLILDPSGCAFTWIEGYLKHQSISFETTNQNADRFTYNLELAVRFGKCFIVQDCQLIRPPLLSIIFPIIHSRFNKKLLQVGNKLIDYHEDFKLVLVTKMTDVNIGTDVEAYVTKIPFTTTVSGYTDQLMAKTIQFKKPELEIQRKKLLQNEGQLWKQQLELQDRLLEELSTAQGDILKNEILLKTLNEVKESSASIDKSINESSKIRGKLMDEYNQYRGICESAAKLFIGIAKIYNMSETVFTALFLKSIKETEDLDQTGTYRQLVRLTYSTLSRSISKKDYVLLGLHICKNAYPEQISVKEWESFITNFMSIEDSSADSSIPDWISKELRPKVLALKAAHSQLYTNLNLENESQWTKYLSNPTDTEPPVNISDFHKILITQIFRPDRLSTTIAKSITKMLGTSNLSIVKPTIQQLADESTKDSPILLITTGDTDPSKEIQDYVQEKIGRNKFIEISIGKGQEKQTMEVIRKAIETGIWICLKNVHLVPHWLEMLNQELDRSDVNDNFRLWLLCDSADNLPQSLVVKSNKILYESPSGMKNKVLRLINLWMPMLSKKKDSKQLRLYVILFMLNAILQERRVYIPQGWSKWYDFSDSDLRTAISMMEWIEKSIGFKIDWSVLKGLCQNIAYGGRINNPDDLIILETHLNEFFDTKTFSQQWSCLAFKFTLPQSTKLSDYQSAIGKLDDKEMPEHFGLSASTNVSKDLLFCRNLLKQLRSSYFSTVDNENFEKRIKPILSLWKKLTSNTSVLKTAETIENIEVAKNPWHSFVLSELRIAGVLFKIIHKTLVLVHNTARNSLAMHGNDKKFISSICENQVPFEWRQIWSGPKLITDYIKSVVQRGSEAEKRFGALSNALFGDSIDFARVFSVESYLAALKLTNARELGKSTSELVLTSSLCGFFFKSGITSPSIASLQIDGALFKNNKIYLSDQQHNANDTSSTSALTSLITIPEFQLNFTQQSDVADDKITIALPLYTNVSREYSICTIKLGSSVKRESVLLSGAALIVPDVSQM